MDILSQLQAARVTNPMQAQVFPFVLYDSLIYPAGGTTQMSFFQTPIGQGVTSASGAAVGSPKTYADTNMNLAGQLPSGMEFLVKCVEVIIEPGISSAANEFLPARAAALGSPGSATILVGSLNDVNEIAQSGWLEFNILQQNYVRDAPLSSFPPKARRVLDAVALNTAVTADTAGAGLLRVDGRPWYVDGDGLPGIAIQPATNFEVLLKFPGPVPTPSGSNARARVRLDGYVVRASQ